MKSSRAPRQRPIVAINLAMTADAKIATANRALTSFGSATDHAHLYALRATADAVMTGAGTINAQRSEERRVGKEC